MRREMLDWGKCQSMVELIKRMISISMEMIRM